MSFWFKALVSVGFAFNSTQAMSQNSYPWAPEVSTLVGHESPQILLLGDPHHGDPEQRSRLLSFLEALSGYECLLLEIDERMDEVLRLYQEGQIEYGLVEAYHAAIAEELQIQSQSWADKYIEDFQRVIDVARNKGMQVFAIDMNYGDSAGKYAVASLLSSQNTGDEALSQFIEWNVLYRNQQMTKNIDQKMQNSCKSAVVFVGLGHLLNVESFLPALENYTGEMPVPINHMLEILNYDVLTIYMLGAQRLLLSPPRFF
jgi:hypothetical protein